MGGPMKNKGILESKGQVLMIIGIVIALGLYLVTMAADFGSALNTDVKEKRLQGTSQLRSLEKGFRETYGNSVRGGVGYGELNSDLEEFVRFTVNRSGARDIHYLFSSAVKYNSSHIKAGVHNFLLREIENVKLNGTSCSSGDLPSGGSCSLILEDTGDEYTIGVSYADSDGTNHTKRYTGLTGPRGNHTGLFYRTELGIGSTELVSEKEAWSRGLS